MSWNEQASGGFPEGASARANGSQFTPGASRTPDTSEVEFELGRALLFAQQVADETIAEARREAAQLLESANRNRINRLLDGANRARTSERSESSTRPDLLVAGNGSTASDVEQDARIRRATTAVDVLEGRVQAELEAAQRAIEAARRRTEAELATLRAQLADLLPPMSTPEVESVWLPYSADDGSDVRRQQPVELLEEQQ